MRFILLLALLLYNIVTNSAGFDYDDVDGDRRQPSQNSRRDWRKRALNKPQPHSPTHTVLSWNNRMYDDHHDPVQSAMVERGKQMERVVNRGRYDGKSETGPKLAEIHYNFDPKTEETKGHIMNCVGPHERYEACFAGCAAVSCDTPRDRLRPCYPFCESGCICVHPYVRDDRTHKCVLPDNCTKGLKGIPDLLEEGP